MTCQPMPAQALATLIVQTWEAFEDKTQGGFCDPMEARAAECAALLSSGADIPDGLRKGFEALSALYSLPVVPAELDFTFDEICNGLRLGVAPYHF